MATLPRLHRAVESLERDLYERRWRYQHRRELAMLARYRDFTMVPDRLFVDSLRLAREGAAAGPGDIVECGTWRGGMSAAIAECIDSRDHLSVLFDSFEGLPAADPIRDGQRAVTWQAGPSNETFDNCTATEDDARRAMTMAGQQCRIVKGWFEQSLPPYAAEGRPIAVLRVDGDWYDSTLTCLRTLFDLVIPGGVVILDDYGSWEGCTRAVHGYLSEAQRVETIERTRDGLHYLVHV